MSQRDGVDEAVDKIRMLLGRGLKAMAEEQLEALLVDHRDDMRVRVLEVECLQSWSDNQSAERRILQLMAEGRNDDATLRQAASIFTASGRLDLALDAIERIGEVDDTSDLIRIDVLERMGRVDEAAEALEAWNPEAESFEINRVQLQARILASQKRFEEAERFLSDWFGQLDFSRVPDSRRPAVCETLFIQTGIRDRMKDYAGAWASAERAHRLDARPFAEDKYRKILDDMRRVFASPARDSLVQADEIDLEPLIILGNPRSGTSLLDQILGMHPEVGAGGELVASRIMQSALGRITDSFLPFPLSLADLRVSDANELGRIYIESTSQLQGSHRFLSNKSLAMHSQLGMMAMCLPRTRVVNLRRHPLDNMVSCFTTNLLASGHTYTNRIEVLAEIWILRHEMQNFWPDALQLPFLDLHYEDLVTEQDSQTRRILDFLDVPFDEACLDFHRSDRQVVTLSARQVKQKMYTSSKERWRNYEAQLEPILDRMAPYL